MKGRDWALLLGVVAPATLGLAVSADRALLSQARATAAAGADEKTRLTAFAVRHALGLMEDEALAGRIPDAARVERVPIPALPQAGSGASVPYGERRDDEVLTLLGSSGVTESGLPEAVVAWTALEQHGRAPADSRRALAERLLAGELPVAPADLPELAALLGAAGDARFEPLRLRLQTAPPAHDLPPAPRFRRFLAPTGRVESWTRVDGTRLVLSIPAHDLLATAQVTATTTLAGAPAVPGRGPRRDIAVPDIQGLILTVAAEDVPSLTPQRAALWLAALLVILAVGVMASGVARTAAAVEREKAFLASVTHELRTPLAAIRVFGETLAQGRGEPREYGTLVAEETQRLEALVERVLAITRIDARPELARVEPRAVVESALTLVEPRAIRRHVSIERDIPIDLPVALWDGEAVRRALVNLIDNAVRYGRPSGCVLVRAALADGHIALAVQDDGPGIARADRPGLFGRFERRREGGTGLGLYLVQQVALAHSGRVDLVSEEGRGATFTLVLPVEPPGPRVS